MNRNEYLNAISAKLKGLSEEDLKKALAFYKEALDDRIEEGMTEEEAIADIGTPEDIAAQIAAEIPLSKLIKAKAKTSRSPKVWEIVLLVIFFPIWAPILLSLFILVFSVYISLWFAVLAFVISAVAIILTGAAGLLASVILIPHVTVFNVIAFLGVSFLLLGIGCFLLIPTAFAFLGMVKLGGVLIRAIKRMFVAK